MSGQSAVRDLLRERFKLATEHAYDVTDALAAFWLYAVQLANFESKSSAVSAHNTTSGALHRLRSIDDESFARQGLLSHEVSALVKIADECSDIGLPQTAESLRRFSAVSEMLVDDPPESSWCQNTIEELECGICHHKARYLFWQVVNTTRRPDLRTEAQRGHLCNEARCYICDHSIQRSPFFYCDPWREEFLIFWPYGTHADPSDMFEACRNILDQMPLEMRNGKSNIVCITGMPVAVFRESNVAAITLCQSEGEFGAVVNDDLLFNVEPWGNMEAMPDYFAAKRFVANEKWRQGAGAFARSFLKDPARVSFLGNIDSCLRNLGRIEEAERLLQEAERLHGFLSEHGVIKRLVRKSGASDLKGEALYGQILSSGLPIDWGFAEMLDQLKSIAEE